LALLVQPFVWIGVSLWTIELVCWILTLQRTPLGVAYPILALTYATIPLASAAFLREQLTRTQIGGAALVAIGVFCVGISGT
jgi:drug/metabolite transporter (DMT)-like permease